MTRYIFCGSETSDTAAVLDKDDLYETRTDCRVDDESSTVPVERFSILTFVSRTKFVHVRDPPQALLYTFYQLQDHFFVSLTSTCSSYGLSFSSSLSPTSCT